MKTTIRFKPSRRYYCIGVVTTPWLGDVQTIWVVPFPFLAFRVNRYRAVKS